LVFRERLSEKGKCALLEAFLHTSASGSPTQKSPVPACIFKAFGADRGRRRRAAVHQDHAVRFVRLLESRKASDEGNTAQLNPSDRKKLLSAFRTDSSSSTTPISRRPVSGPPV
jgi:hypothetical protein